jgi:purine-binding chemotaxis protein CheW
LGLSDKGTTEYFVTSGAMVSVVPFFFARCRVPPVKLTNNPTRTMSAIASAPVNETAVAASLPGKYLTFTLQGESYGIEVLKVREIIRHLAITTVPQMPGYIRGVINLRGKIIPVMDLRVRFGFPNTTDTEQTCIVVVQVKLPDGRPAPMGLVVDGVEEVLNFYAADIEATPDFGGQIAVDYILGMAKVKGVVKVLLDIDRVVGATDRQALSVLQSKLN